MVHHPVSSSIRWLSTARMIVVSSVAVALVVAVSFVVIVDEVAVTPVTSSPDTIATQPLTTTTTTTNNHHDDGKVLFCRIHHSDVLVMSMSDGTTIAKDGDDEDAITTTVGVTECYPTVTVNERSTTDIPLVHEVVIVLDDTDEATSSPSLIGHMGHSILYDYLQYHSDWVHPLTQQIRIPSHIIGTPITYRHDHPKIQKHLQEAGIITTAQKQSTNHHHHHIHGRHLQRTVTPTTANRMLAVRVASADEDVSATLAEIESYLFGTNEESFASIHAQCTMGQKIIVPYNDDIPVYDIQLTSGNSSDFTFGSFFTSVEPQIIALLFNTTTTTAVNTTTNITITTNSSTTEELNATEPPADDESSSSSSMMQTITSLSELVEYVVLIGPKGLRPTTQQPNFRFVAAGAYDSYKVVITDDWIDTPQVIQHEIGHNYNFGHPWENSVIYGDTTSVMGQVYRNTMYNCYSGVHYHHAGWMANKTLTLDMSENATSMTSMMTDLAFYGHADRIPNNDDETPALIVVNGFYIIYNHAMGVNAETHEYANGVLLHRYRETNVSQSGSDLVAVLELSENSDDDEQDSRSYTSTEFDIRIELCSQNEGADDSEPDTVTLVIGSASAGGSIVCPDGASDVPSGSPVPSMSPVPTIVPTTPNASSETPSDSPTDMPDGRRRRRHRRTTRRQT